VTITYTRPLAGKAPEVGAVFSTLCTRCDRRMRGIGIGIECVACVAAAQEVWPDARPIMGEVSGA
jgi:hypothetical protein